MTDKIQCPLCLNAEGGSCKWIPNWNHQDVSRFKCDICGTYRLTREAYKDYMDRELTSYQRAILSHKVRTISSNGDKEMQTLTRDLLWSWISDGTLPSPTIQAENFIRFVGDKVSRSNINIAALPLCVYAIIGAKSYQSALDLTKELQERGLLKLNFAGTVRRISKSSGFLAIPTDITLSLDGWERYEAGKLGKFEGSYGFIAMQFKDPDLDPFVRDVVKPIVKDGIGYDLVDMRDVSEAGIIDNIMRIRIRDSAFVIADLTHDNRGAYWEAGYAEGLGKPVVYICEKTKFGKKGTHFDTNHYTTVLWSRDDPEGFGKELIATLRRSLDLSLTGT